MFSKMSDFSLISRQGKKIVSALLSCSVLVVSFSESLNAQRKVNTSKTVSENLLKNNPPTDFELKNFQAETTFGGVKISHQGVHGVVHGIVVGIYVGRFTKFINQRNRKSGVPQSPKIKFCLKLAQTIGSGNLKSTN